ncbi:putative pilus assembly protein [Bifidobacterium [indicum] DSM 20214 = LMG 11587]|uniref:Putative pilus assembly protein n=2 Tax=Bifidobacterium coryneforme TaxID=1687 RepID=A0A087VVH5_9BIFI|nr:putative pilus assembly protein [Bifidobacterium indicum LMG 11587 = DSM 20214]
MTSMQSVVNGQDSCSEGIESTQLEECADAEVTTMPNGGRGFAGLKAVRARLSQKVYDLVRRLHLMVLVLIRRGAVRLKVLTSRPESGAATAEYAVVLIAATAFAGLLLVILKSDTVRSLLSALVKQALSV